jgi:hypothetical protein
VGGFVAIHLISYELIRVMELENIVANTVYIKARESKSLAVNQAVALAFCCFFVSFT